MAKRRSTGKRLDEQRAAARRERRGGDFAARKAAPAKTRAVKTTTVKTTPVKTTAVKTRAVTRTAATTTPLRVTKTVSKVTPIKRERPEGRLPASVASEARIALSKAASGGPLRAQRISAGPSRNLSFAEAQRVIKSGRKRTGKLSSLFGPKGAKRRRGK